MLIVGHNTDMNGRVKKELFKFFDMKDLGHVRQILDTKIVRDRKNHEVMVVK